MSFDRAERANAVLAAAGLAGAERIALAGDASTRRYERIRLNGARAILMDAEPRAESAPCPPLATPAERAALGYNAEARLAASRVEAFVAIAQKLSALGLSAPSVLAFDLEAGFAVIEDFGDRLYWSLLCDGAPREPLYLAAIEALAALHGHEAPPALAAGEAVWPLLTYDETALRAEAALLPDWFVGTQLGLTLTPEARASWDSAWAGPLALLAQAKPVITLRDFHSPNVMWLPDRVGPRRAGLLDFQDALAGHPAYDVVSLLEDARTDVDADFAAAMLERYMDIAAIADREAFRAAFAILGAQRNSKIVGIFARLKYRDAKPHYVQEHQPRVLRYLRRDLQNPALAELARWFATHVFSGEAQQRLEAGEAA